MKRHGRFLHWLRTWDPRGFPNPFYSPSYAAFCAGQDTMKVILDGLNSVTCFLEGMSVALLSEEDAKNLGILEDVQVRIEHVKDA